MRPIIALTAPTLSMADPATAQTVSSLDARTALGSKATCGFN